MAEYEDFEGTGVPGRNRTIRTIEKDQPNGVPGLNGSGELNPSVIPVGTNTNVANTDLTLDANRTLSGDAGTYSLSFNQLLSFLLNTVGDIALNTGATKNFIIPASNAPDTEIISPQQGSLKYGLTEGRYFVNNGTVQRLAYVSDIPTVLQDNISASVAPTSTDDSTAGYSVGSRWFDLTGSPGLGYYVCRDATATAAEWEFVSYQKWQPTAITLGDFQSNGAGLVLSSGAGYYYNFDSASDDEIVSNVALTRNGLAYDGTGVILELEWMKFGATGGTVGWEIDYAWVGLGDDAFTKVDGTVLATVDVTALADQTLTETQVIIPAGTSGDKILALTIRRNSQGGGSDTYSGDAELYGVNLRK